VIVQRGIRESVLGFEGVHT